MHMQKTLTCLFEKYSLGKIQRDSLSVEGGLLHQMYHVVKDQGAYAVKLLNPNIMKRPKALGNMVNSEYIAECMAEYGTRRAFQGKAAELPNVIPVIAAIKLQGQHIALPCRQKFLWADHCRHASDRANAVPVI